MMKDNQTGIKSGTTSTQNVNDWRAIYFARDRADKKEVMKQCKELSEHLERTGFDVWVMGSDKNNLIFYGKDIADA